MNDAFGRYGFVVEDGDFEAEAVLQQGVWTFSLVDAQIGQSKPVFMSYPFQPF